MLVFVGKNKMLTNAYIFNLIEKSRAFVVIIGLFGRPKENSRAKVCYGFTLF